MVTFPMRLLSLSLVFGLLFASASCIKSNREGDEHEPKHFGELQLQRFNEIGGPFSLTDQQGKKFNLADQKGKAVVLFFGYLTCPDVCPTTLMDLAKVNKALGPDAKKVVFAFVTLDPERDSSEKLRDYLINFDESFVGLGGTAEQIKEVTKVFKVGYKRREQPSALGYTIDHSSGTYLIDPSGNLRYIFAFKSKLKFVTEGIRKVANLPVETAEAPTS